MSKQQDYVRTQLRVPPDVHRAVHDAARAAERTFNAEIVHLLRTSLRVGAEKGGEQAKQEAVL